ncbi:MAG: glycosyltransferase [Brockia lithotrophica]|nr:glycosyltransferase [Brockia lithotrophica]
MDEGVRLSEVPKREAFLLSVAMIVRDEAEKLPRALTSVRDFADEIVVVDTGSADDTPEIAAAHGAQVFSFPWRGSFAEARNASLERCRGRWILVLDADEWLTTESGPALRELLEREERTPCCEAYQVRIVNLVADAMGEPRRLAHFAVRLFRNNPAYRFTGRVHEQILPSILQHASSRHSYVVGTAPIELLHDGYEHVAKDKVMRNLELLEREWAEDPANPFTAYNLGVEYLRLKDTERAVEFLERSIALSPPRMAYLPFAYRYLAHAYASKGDLSNALKAATRGTEPSPTHRTSGTSGEISPGGRKTCPRPVKPTLRLTPWAILPPGILTKKVWALTERRSPSGDSTKKKETLKEPSPGTCAPYDTAPTTQKSLPPSFDSLPVRGAKKPSRASSSPTSEHRTKTRGNSSYVSSSSSATPVKPKPYAANFAKGKLKRPKKGARESPKTVCRRALRKRRRKQRGIRLAACVPKSSPPFPRDDRPRRSRARCRGDPLGTSVRR